MRLWLSDDDKVQSILDVNCVPDFMSELGLPIDTGITLQELKDWAAGAEKGREVRDELPQDGPIEQKAIEFFNKILLPNSDDRKSYELALTMSQILEARLYIVLELLDEQGRLSPLPWELLHDGLVDEGRGFLGLKYPVYRRPDSVSSLAQVTGSIEKALIVAAGKLPNLDDEVSWLAKTLKEHNIAVDQCVQESDPEIIKNKIRHGGYDALHFVGHGQFNAEDPSQSKLLLGRPRQQDKVLTAAALAELARESSLVFVFLSACEGAEQAAQLESQPWKEAGIVEALIRAGVPSAVGMRWEVGGDNSKKLAEVFYEQLLKYKMPAEDALMSARQALEQEPDWANPILTKRHGVLAGGA